MPTSEIVIVVPLNVPEARQLLAGIEMLVRQNVGEVYFVDVRPQVARNAPQGRTAADDRTPKR